MTAKYICFEGLEGTGKTTQTALLGKTLTDLGYKVLATKEPGSMHAPITMVLRGIMLDQQYDDQLTPSARELISQSIRSIHLEKVIYPAMKEYDYIIQDRGILSGLAYGSACGNSPQVLEFLMNLAAGKYNPYSIYDHVVYLKGDVAKYLNIARSAKQEFSAGDAIELKGVGFMQDVREKMDAYSVDFNTSYITVDGKGIEEVHAEILGVLGLEKQNNGKS